MKSRIIDHSGGKKTFVLIFDTDDEVIKGITDFAKNQQLSASQFSAIGAFKNVTLGYFDFSVKDYKKIPIEEQVEVLSLIGDIALHKGEPKVHAHVVVGRADGTAHGGHLLEAFIRPTLEVVLRESPAYLKRKTDEATGLALIDVSASE